MLKHLPIYDNQGLTYAYSESIEKGSIKYMDVKIYVDTLWLLLKSQSSIDYERNVDFRRLSRTSIRQK